MRQIKQTQFKIGFFYQSNFEIFYFSQAGMDHWDTEEHLFSMHLKRHFRGPITIPSYVQNCADSVVLIYVFLSHFLTL
jgi:hypothetical protein